MARYAKTTTVPVNKSRSQIQDELERFGVDEFFFGTSKRGQGIGFKYNERVYKMNVPLPERTEGMSENQYQQALRQRWRVLRMSMKMELEKIESGVISFEDQFLAQMCLPDGSNVSQFMRKPENLELLSKSKMPKMLTG